MDIMDSTFEEVVGLLLAELNRDSSGLITRNATILISVAEMKLRERLKQNGPSTKTDQQGDNIISLDPV